MYIITEQSAQRAHTRILENLLVSSAFLESMAETLNAVKAAHLTPQQSEVRRQLSRAYDGEAISYRDYEASASAIQKMALNIWNPMMEGCTKDVASIANTLFRVGWQIDNEPEKLAGEGVEIPDVFQRLRFVLDQLADQDVLELTPYKRLLHEGEMKAIGRAIDTAESLPSLQSRKVSAQDQSLAKLNVEFVSVQALSAWMFSLSRKDVLPASSAPILTALQDVEKVKHIRPETRIRLTEAWVAANPNTDERFIQATVNALLGSACSTKLDTLHQSASEVVSEIVCELYETRDIRQRQQNQTDRAHEMSNLNETLEELHNQLIRLNYALPLHATTTTVKSLNALVSQLGAQIDQVTSQPDHSDDEPMPG